MGSTAVPVRAPHHHSPIYNATPTTPLISTSTSPVASGTNINVQSSNSPRVNTREPSEPEISLHCQSLKEVQVELEKLIKKQQNALIPEQVWCQFMLHTGATFSIESDNGSGGNDNVASGDEKGGGGSNGGELDTARSKTNGADIKPPRTAISLSEVLDVSKEDKKRHEVQIAVSKAIVTVLEEIDEFRYTRRNSWETKARDGLRLSYACSESLQNHDRTANRPRKKSSTVADSSASPGNNRNSIAKDGAQQVDEDDISNGIQQTNANVPSGQNNFKSNGLEKNQYSKPLPTYDCRGNVMVKYLALQQCIVIVYRHNPIHRRVSRRTEDDLMAVGQVTGSVTAVVEKPKRKRTKKSDGR